MSTQSRKSKANRPPTSPSRCIAHHQTYMSGHYFRPSQRRCTGDCGLCCVRDYCAPLPVVVRPLITERDQRRTDDPLHPAIKLLDRDTQQLIHHKEQDQWRTLLQSSDRATNLKSYWSLLRKLGCKWVSRLQNISIDSREILAPDQSRLLKLSTGSLLPVRPSPIGQSRQLHTTGKSW